MTESVQKGSHWSVTINNPTADDEEQIAIARQRGWKVEGQMEEGRNGTLHYQLHVNTPQVRFSAVKKQFPRAHIELARNSTALAKYVVKSDTRVGTLQEAQEKYPSLVRYWGLISDWIDRAYPWCRSPLHAEVAPQPLRLLDDATRYLVRCGYNVESMAVNPMVRAMWKSFWKEIMERHEDAKKKEAERVAAQWKVIADAHVAIPTLDDQSIPVGDNQPTNHALGAGESNRAIEYNHAPQISSTEEASVSQETDASPPDEQA